MTRSKLFLGYFRLKVSSYSFLFSYISQDLLTSTDKVQYINRVFIVVN